MNDIKHTLKEYLELLTEAGLTREHKIIDEKQTIEQLSHNSKECTNSSLFVCKGAHFSIAYLQEAVSKGAVCYVSETPYSCEGELSYIIVSDIRKAMALLASLYFNNAYEALKLIGITGTKGKSTTAYFVKYILDEYCKEKSLPSTAIISSIDTYDGVINKESHLTTPEAIDLHSHFNNAAMSRIPFFTMEVSSQALKYDRVSNVVYDVGCFLNIGEDHISALEHPDMDDYIESKLRLFAQSKFACVNVGTVQLDRVLAAAKQSPNVITFGTDSGADIYSYDIKKVENDIVFRVKCDRFDREFMITMPGLFNVENALAAIAICYALGIPDHYMYVGLVKARASGRMEIYTNADNRIITIVDYAHNRISFENLFKSITQEYPNRKIVTVFGCPGKKALTRRRDLGEISGKYSDKVIVTEEDPGEEPIGEICQEVAKYVEQENCECEIFEDRGDAIEAAIMNVKENSIILITGKGNETRQKRGTEYVPCPTDVDYARKFLKEYDILHKIDSNEHMDILLRVLPDLQKYHGKTIVIKYGGSALESQELIDSILEDISLLKMVGARVMVVHGGGAKINSVLKQLNVEPKFVGGYRVTDESTMEVVEMVLSGSINKSIVHSLHKYGIDAVGLSGKDSGLLRATQKSPELGLVGEITSVNGKILGLMLDNGYIPVISPVAEGVDGKTYNINADDAACAVAEAVKADKLIFLTNVEGLLLDDKNIKTLLTKINVRRVADLINNGFVGGGMVPKLTNCVKAIENGVEKVVIMDGRIKHSLLLESISKKGRGTSIISETVK